jgi:hypothetical protein
MNRSFFTSTKDSVLATGSANFSLKISATPTAYGLVAAQATAYAALNTTFQTSYVTATTPATRTKSTVAAKDAARIPLRQMASDLAKIIDGTPTVTNSQKIDLGISIRVTPTPRGAPGTPFKFVVSLASSGALTLQWKCNNPKGSSGTMYQVWRRVSATTNFEYLGGSGDRKFIDDTIPAGSSQVTYKIQAVRSTAVGAFAEYNVNFGVSGSAPIVEEVAPMRKAA